MKGVREDRRLHVSKLRWNSFREQEQMRDWKQVKTRCHANRSAGNQSRLELEYVSRKGTYKCRTGLVSIGQLIFWNEKKILNLISNATGWVVEQMNLA